MSKRHRFIIEEAGDFLVVKANGAVVYCHPHPVAYGTKRSLASLWGKRLKRYFYEFGQLSELYTRLKDGRLSDPRSFGRDPRAIRG